MFNAEFEELLNEYKISTETTEKLRLFILQSLFEKGVKEAVLKFQDAALELKDPTGEALSYVMLFWLTYCEDINLAKKYNDKAREIYEKMPDFSTQTGYLSVLNNDLLVANLTGDIKGAYEIVQKSLKYCKKINNTTYFIAFSNNYTYVLNEIGFYNEALQNVLDIFKYSEYMPPINLVSTKYILAYALIATSKYEEAKRIVYDLIAENKTKKYYNEAIFKAILIEIYINTQEIEDIDSIVKQVVKAIKNEEKLNTNTIFMGLSLAKYFLFKKDYVNAKTYYDLCYENINQCTGRHGVILRGISEVYGELKIYDKAYEYARLANEYGDKVKNLLYDILMNKEKSIKNKNSNLYLKSMYNKLNAMDNFNKAVNEKFNFESIDDAIKTFLPKLITYQKSTLLIIDNTDKQAFYLENGKTIYVDYYSDFITKMARIKKLIKDVDSLSMSFKSISFDDSDEVEAYPLLTSENELVGVLIVGYTFDMANNAESRRYMYDLIDRLVPAIDRVNKYLKALHDSTVDNLTNLQNRYALDNRINLNINKNEVNYCCVIIDIDDFKNVNDTYGHLAGDKILTEFSEIVINHFNYENIYRVGGEEFLVIGDQNINEVLDTFMKELNDHKFEYNGSLIKITVSIGCAFSNTYKEFYKTYDKADEKLYLAKTRGKNNYCL